MADRRLQARIGTRSSRTDAGLALPLLLLAGGFGLLVFAAMGLDPSRARAGDVLSNGGFENWPLQPDWGVGAGAAQRDDAIAVAGASARFVLSASTTRIRQYVPAAPLATYQGTVLVAAEGQVRVRLTVEFEADGVALRQLSTDALLTSLDFAPLTVEIEAPTEAALVRFQVDLWTNAGTATAWVDSAVLEEVAPPAPTPTPTATETPTQTPSETPTPSPTPTKSATAGQGATPTFTATSAPRTPTATRTATATRTPTRPPGASGSNPPPSGNAGGDPGPGGSPVAPLPGLLVNGDFELGDDDGPSGWSKVGGSTGRSPAAQRGSWAATLLSDSASTKWIWQLVPVTGGSWYEASAWGRVESGAGEVFVRVSWYAASDGSGTYLRQDDSPVSVSSDWAHLGTGPVLAPPAARSAAVRLMLRPSGSASAAFDAAIFVAASQPTPTPTTLPSATNTPATAVATATALRRTSTAASSPSPAGTILPLAGSTPPLAASGGSLMLWEVMSDPQSADDDNLHEWVEVHNPGASAVSLLGWSIADGNASDVLPAAEVSPGGFVVIAARDAGLPGDITRVAIPDGRIGSGLNNGGDALSLVAPDGSLVDAMEYGDGFEVAAPAEGETAGRLPGGQGWAFTLRPSPGFANVFPVPPAIAGASNTTAPAETGPQKTAVAPVAIPVAVTDERPSIVPWVILVCTAALGGFATATLLSGARKHRGD